MKYQITLHENSIHKITYYTVMMQYDYYIHTIFRWPLLSNGKLLYNKYDIFVYLYIQVYLYNAWQCSYYLNPYDAQAYFQFESLFAKFQSNSSQLHCLPLPVSALMELTAYQTM